MHIVTWITLLFFLGHVRAIKKLKNISRIDASQQQIQKYAGGMQHMTQAEMEKTVDEWAREAIKWVALAQAWKTAANAAENAAATAFQATKARSVPEMRDAAAQATIATVAAKAAADAAASTVTKTKVERSPEEVGVGGGNEEEEGETEEEAPKKEQTEAPKERQRKDKTEGKGKGEAKGKGKMKRKMKAKVKGVAGADNEELTEMFTWRLVDSTTILAVSLCGLLAGGGVAFAVFRFYWSALSRPVSEGEKPLLVAYSSSPCPQDEKIDCIGGR